MKKSDKIYKYIGQATIVILTHLGFIALFVFGFMQNTIY